MIAALTIDIGSPTGTGVTLGVAWERLDADRQQYRYWVQRPDGQHLHHGQDLRSGAGDPVNHVQMMGTLLGFLAADAEKYLAYEMGCHGQEPPDGYLFGRDVAELAYLLGDELAMAREELEANQ